jgi:hypothetical protein
MDKKTGNKKRGKKGKPKDISRKQYRKEFSRKHREYMRKYGKKS